MNQGFFHIFFLLLELLLLQGAHSALCSQTEQCHNETLKLDCHDSFPMKFSNDTTVILCNRQIDIENDIVIRDAIGIHLTSCGDNRTKLVCTRSAVGFKFFNVVNLHISSIVFDGCGIILDHVEVDDSHRIITGGLVISHCQNVTLNNVTVQNSVGTGLIVNQTSGEILITNSSFDRNCKDGSMFSRAGGLYIEFVHDINASEATTVCYIDSCEFMSNNCSVLSLTDGLGSAIKYQGFSEGGGLRLVFKHNASKNNVTIRNSRITKNSALWGGGIRVNYQYSPQNNSVVVQNSHFVKNKCFYRGGGIDIAFEADYSQSSTTWNIVKFEKCVVEENEADQYGGGLRIYSSRNTFLAMNMTFSECSFSRNKALYGPAVDMLPYSVDVFNDGYLSSVSFNNCNFSTNSVTNKSNDNSTQRTFKHYQSGKGVFACDSFFLYIYGKNTFENNQGSAMYLSSCKIQFESGSQVSFINNSGYDGGAMILFGKSVLYVKDNSTILFVGNTAVRKGGAIMYFSNNEHDFIALKSCFIQYLGQTPNVTERMIQLNFTENKAEYGQAIFASTLRPCQRLCIEKQLAWNWTTSNHVSIEETFGCIGNVIISNNVDKKISTSGEIIDYVDSNTTGTISVIPGQEVGLNFNMNDELSHQTYDTFHVSIQGKTSEAVSISIDPSYTYVTGRKVVKLYGRPGENAKLVLTNAEFQPITVIANVLMKHCPPGFVLSEDTNDISCVCSVETQNKRYVGITRCSSQKKVAYLRGGYWVGYENKREIIEDELITGQCPRGFCKSYISKSSSLLNEYKLPKNASISDLDSYICGHHRTGKLCGRCRPNNSVFFHSKKYFCYRNNHTCKVSVLLYIVSELLPVTVLFMIIIIFDIRFTSGSLNSLLFYVQMIDVLVIEVKGIIQPHRTIDVMIKANQLLYGIFNLEFFTLDALSLSFCMWSTASTLDILAFKYITITYSLILIILTVVLMKFCNPGVIRKLCVCSDSKEFSAKTSIIHGLAAFLVICYAQSTYVSISILTPGHIHSIGSSMSNNVTTVVYHDGDMPFMEKQHLKYAVPAIIFTIIFTIIPPLLLIVYPLCYKIFALLRLQESSCVRVLCMLVPLEKLKPFFDSFQGCFKDEYRFFAGLFFIYRLLALTSYAVTDSLTLFYTLLEIQLVITLIIHAVVQPYKQKWHNQIDVLLLGFLVLINALTMYNYQNSYRDLIRFKTEINIAAAVQIIFAFLPLICLAMYGAKKAINRITQCHTCMKKEVENRDEDMTDTLTMVDMRERNYTESGYHRF